MPKSKSAPSSKQCVGLSSKLKINDFFDYWLAKCVVENKFLAIFHAVLKIFEKFMSHGSENLTDSSWIGHFFLNRVFKRGF